MQTTDSGLQYEDTIEGTGAVAAAGQSVRVHYTGWLYNNGARGAGGVIPPNATLKFDVELLGIK